MEKRPLLSLKKPVIIKPVTPEWIIIPPAAKKVVKNKPVSKKKPFKKKAPKALVDAPKMVPGKRTMLRWLYETFPKAFLKKRTPLKTGIHKDIFALLPVHFGEITGIHRKRARENLSNALAFYCATYGYQISVCKQTHRIDLEGNPVEEILPEHKELAEKKAKKLEAKKAKKELQEKEQKKDEAT